MATRKIGARKKRKLREPKVKGTNKQKRRRVRVRKTRKVKGGVRYDNDTPARVPVRVQKKTLIESIDEAHYKAILINGKNYDIKIANEFIALCDQLFYIINISNTEYPTVVNDKTVCGEDYIRDSKYILCLKINDDDYKLLFNGFIRDITYQNAGFKGILLDDEFKYNTSIGSKLKLIVECITDIDYCGFPFVQTKWNKELLFEAEKRIVENQSTKFTKIIDQKPIIGNYSCRNTIYDNPNNNKDIQIKISKIFNKNYMNLTITEKLQFHIANDLFKKY